MLFNTQNSSYPISMTALMQESVEKKGSDLHLVVGVPPCIRIDGKLTRCDYPALSPSDLEYLIGQIINDEQKKILLENWELDFSYAIPQCARFRGNVIFQRGTLAIVLRVVPFKLPKLDELYLPKDIERLCTLTRGLILVTGPTGSGKSTTIAAMINHINQTRATNIISIEDPIEFLHTHQMSTIRQREVGTDTHTFSSALRHALRHDPDIITIGEMRDLESISIALTAAETGHLVLSTLHTQTAPLSISRIVDSFPGDSKLQVRQQLAGTLKAVISQQLVPTIEGKRVAAVEYMVDVPSVRSMIRESREHQLYSVIQTSREQGMKTMDQSLAELFITGRISYDIMMQYAVDTKEVQRLAQNGL